MIDDARLRREIRLMAAAAEPPGGTRERIMAAVAADASTAAGEPAMARVLRGAAVGVSFAVAFMMVAVLVGSHPGVRNAGAPAAAPGRDPAAVLYSSTVDADMNLIDRDYATRFSCRTRIACAAELVVLEADTQKLRADLAALPPPAGEAAPARRLEAAALQFTGELEAALAAVDRPDADFVAASAMPRLDALDLAAGGVVCWPATPVQDEHGVSCR